MVLYSALLVSSLYTGSCSNIACHYPFHRRVNFHRQFYYWRNFVVHIVDGSVWRYRIPIKTVLWPSGHLPPSLSPSILAWTQLHYTDAIYPTTDWHSVTVPGTSLGSDLYELLAYSIWTVCSGNGTGRCWDMQWICIDVAESDSSKSPTTVMNLSDCR